MKKRIFSLCLGSLVALAIVLVSEFNVLATTIDQHNSSQAQNYFANPIVSTVSSILDRTKLIKSSDNKAPLLDGMGNYHYQISTSSELAQRYFDQGLILTYGFNHAEAANSFREAAQLDPDCAMCYWGLALVMGPNINAAMADEAVPDAWTAIQKAIALSNDNKNITPKEKDLIQALANRYTQEPVEDRSDLDRAYVDAMREVAKRYPEDLDASVLFAEALMDTMPWDYWQEDGNLKQEAAEAKAVLEEILAKNPYHPNANHLYIHVVEAKHPELGIEAADRLRNLVPGASHLVHMPGHIYIRVGRYHDAVVANQKATEVDRKYIAQHNPQGLYPMGYIPHNYHFLWFGAIMGGEEKVALKSAQDTAAMVDPEMMRQPGLGTLQHYYVIPYYSLVKFGEWDKILAIPAPAADLVYPNGVWHYARGMAFAAKGQLAQANQELESLQAIAVDPALEGVTIWDINTTTDLLQIASKVLAGDIASKQRDYDRAIDYFQTATAMEDELNYDEPASWYNPVREFLGATLLAADRPAEAEQVYRQDLALYPDNGWSLFGLEQSLRDQGKVKEAKAIHQQFEQAWQYADVQLTASRF
jgi:tetratricopeptide (TPR) repeat protein